MRITEKTITRNMLDDMQANLSRLEDMRRQAATGKAFAKPSDDPVAYSKSLGYGWALDRLEQYKKNAVEAAAIMNTTTNALDQARLVLSDARLEAQRTGTGTVPQETFAASAQTVASLRERLMQIANTKSQGVYIFGGQRTGSAPFSSSAVYEGDEGAMVHDIGLGESVTVNYNGKQVFQDGGDLFAMLSSLQSAMEAGDITAINNAQSDFDSAINQMLEKEAVMGSESQRVEAAQTRLADASVVAESIKSENEDVDIAETLVRLQSLQNSYEASLSSSTQILQMSLFRYLK